jgi:hypothetical protein
LTIDDIREIQDKFKQVLGRKSWGVTLGKGHNLILNFGSAIQAEDSQLIYGEWTLLLYGCAWRIETTEHVLCASADSRSKIQSSIGELEDATIVSIDLSFPSLDTTLTFDNNIFLRLFPVYLDEYYHWKLVDPDDNALIIGPSNRWSID